MVQWIGCRPMMDDSGPAAIYLVEVMRKTRIDVAAMFGVSRQGVARAVDCYNETGSHNNKRRKRTEMDKK
uniref:Uncharacterized protein n=1 Tax=Acrobeloides nanus TaxID=290746 RepID=A0A914CEI1_9BILA